MDLLRFLMALPVRLARAVAHFFRVGWPVVFGRVAWTPPPWVEKVSTSVRKRPADYLLGIFAAFVIVIGGWSGWQWYLHRPHPHEPNRITFAFQSPALTDY